MTSTTRSCVYHSHMWSILTMMGYVTMSVDRSNNATMRYEAM